MFFNNKKNVSGNIKTWLKLFILQPWVDTNGQHLILQEIPDFLTNEMTVN